MFFWVFGPQRATRREDSQTTSGDEVLSVITDRRWIVDRRSHSDHGEDPISSPPVSTSGAGVPYCTNISNWDMPPMCRAMARNRRERGARWRGPGAAQNATPEA